MSNMPVRDFEFKRAAWPSGWLRGVCGCFLGICLGIWLTACQQQSAVSPVPAAGSENASKSVEAMPAVTPDARPVIVAFGDSLTAGYGLSPAQGYTTLLQQKIDAAGLAYRVVNAGVSGDTSAGGLRRLDWSLQDGDIRILILELGGNDGLRGLPVAELKKNLAQIIQAAQKRNIKVVLAGMEATPNLGATYVTGFRAVYRELAKEYKLALIPFVLAGIGGDPALNQPDGIHPNAAGEKIMTENVWRVLEPVLRGK